MNGTCMSYNWRMLNLHTCILTYIYTYIKSIHTYVRESSTNKQTYTYRLRCELTCGGDGEINQAAALLWKENVVMENWCTISFIREGHSIRVELDKKDLGIAFHNVPNRPLYPATVFFNGSVTIMPDCYNNNWMELWGLRDYHIRLYIL